jgi:hypothetical protein
MLGACGAALRRRSELLLIYAFYHNLSDDERSFSLWHTNLKPVANRATLQRIEGDPLDVPRWRGRGDLKAGRRVEVAGASRCVRRSVRGAVPGSADRGSRETSRRIPPDRGASSRRRRSCCGIRVCARGACQLTSQITRIPTPRRVRTRHAPGSSRAGGQRWQRQRRAQARSAPDRHRCSPPVGGPHPGPNTISTP